MKRNIETVIWDLGNVLIKWDPKNLYRKIFEEEEKMDWFLNEVCTMDWNEAQDGGRTWKEGIQLLVAEHPAYTKEINAYWDRWEEMLGGAIEGSATILQHLKEKNSHRLYALTNWSAETFPIALETFDFLQLFEGILVSGAENLKKPDPKIYQLLLDRYQINPATAVFIDDSLRNIKAAKAMGINTIHFTSAEQLSQELTDYGVL